MTTTQSMLKSMMAFIVLNQEKTLYQNEELKQQQEEVQKWLALLEQQQTARSNVVATKKLAKGQRKKAVDVHEKEPGVEDLGKKALDLSVEAQALRKHLQVYK
ncbi:hypothetical protein C0995_016192 [Termitomyces sp. Mi166|nr:hypothetical protein C0995_016192 [Termitomyces sp. Mi166\